MDKLKLAVIGAGGMIGGRRVNYYKEHPMVELAAVCDFPPERALELGKTHGVAAFGDWKELLKEDSIKAVNVSTPNVFHFEITKAALEAGKHVSTEYPVCQTLSEYDELTRLARSNKVVFHDALTVRVEEPHRVIMANLPEIGEPICGRMNFFGGIARWYLDQKIRGSMFLGYHIHYIDQFLELFGEPQWVDASHFIRAEKNIHAGTIMIGFKNDAVAYIEFGMGFQVGTAPHATIRGTRGILTYSNLGKTGSVALINESGKKEIEVVGDPTKPALKRHGENFVEEILDGKPSLNPLEVGRKAITVALAAEQSAEKRSRVVL